MARSRALTDVDDADLVEQLDNTKEELFNLRFQNVTGQLDNYSRLRSLKRDAARLLTELREREIQAAEALTAPAATSGDSAVAPASDDEEAS